MAFCKRFKFEEPAGGCPPCCLSSFAPGLLGRGTHGSRSISSCARAMRPPAACGLVAVFLPFPPPDYPGYAAVRRGVPERVRTIFLARARRVRTAATAGTPRTGAFMPPLQVCQGGGREGRSHRFLAHEGRCGVPSWQPMDRRRSSPMPTSRRTGGSASTIPSPPDQGVRTAATAVASGLWEFPSTLPLQVCCPVCREGAGRCGDPMAAGRPTALFKRTESPARSAPSPASHAGLQRGRRRGGQGRSHGDAACPHSGARQGAIPGGRWVGGGPPPIPPSGLPGVRRGEREKVRSGTQHFPRARGGCVPPRRQGSRTAGVPPPAACSVPQTRRFPWQRPASRLAGPMRHSKGGGDHAPPTRTPRSKILARGGCVIPWRPVGRRRPWERRLHQDARRVALAPVARRTPRRQAPVSRPPGPPAPAVSLRS